MLSQAHQKHTLRGVEGGGEEASVPEQPTAGKGWE